MPIEKVVKLLEICPSKLLEVDFNQVPRVPSCHPLVEALRLSSLSKLRRWRISWSRLYAPSSTPDESAWREACAERGIEVRGHERYFTG